MSIRIYIGNLPQGFNPKEFDTLLQERGLSLHIVIWDQDLAI